MKTPVKFQDVAVITEVTSTASQIFIDVFDYKNSRRGSYNVSHSRHSKQRSCQRGISDLLIAMAIHYGKLTKKQGLEYYTLGDRSIPPILAREKVRNLVVIMSGDTNQIVTCYRTNDASRRIARKRKYLRETKELAE